MNNVLTILDAKDFEHDNYKFTIFTLIESMNCISVNIRGNNFELPDLEDKIKLSDEERQRALIIKIDAKQELFVNEDKTIVDKLSKKSKQISNIF